jgi:hypothetical protein
MNGLIQGILNPEHFHTCFNPIKLLFLWLVSIAKAIYRNQTIAQIAIVFSAFQGGFKNWFYYEFNGNSF